MSGKKQRSTCRYANCTKSDKKHRSRYAHFGDPDFLRESVTDFTNCGGNPLATKNCILWENGFCHRGNDCGYAHKPQSFAVKLGATAGAAAVSLSATAAAAPMPASWSLVPPPTSLAPKPFPLPTACLAAAAAAAPMTTSWSLVPPPTSLAAAAAAAPMTASWSLVPPPTSLAPKPFPLPAACLAAAAAAAAESPEEGITCVSDINSELNTLEHLINLFRTAYNKLQILQPLLHPSVDSKDPASHSATRCFTTREFFESLFSESHTALSETEKQQLKAESESVAASSKIPSNITVTRFCFGGEGFPDHTFLVIHDQTHELYYIIQSYYYAYTVNGKYGFLKLSKAAAARFERMINSYEGLVGNNPLEQADKQQLYTLAGELSRFTGVDSRLHGQDNREKFVNLRTLTHNSKTMPLLRLLGNFSRHMGIQIRALEAFLASNKHATHVNATLSEYQIYDCFISNQRLSAATVFQFTGFTPQTFTTNGHGALTITTDGNFNSITIPKQRIPIDLKALMLTLQSYQTSLYRWGSSITKAFYLFSKGVKQRKTKKTKKNKNVTKRRSVRF